VGEDDNVGSYRQEITNNHNKAITTLTNDKALTGYLPISSVSLMYSPTYNNLIIDKTSFCSVSKLVRGTRQKNVSR